MEFGEFLRSKRESKKMSIRQLALYAGCSDTYLSMLERGSRGKRGPSPAFLRKLASPLGVPYEVLMVAAGYQVQVNEEMLCNGMLVQLMREVLRMSVEEFANRIGISNFEIETLEREGVSAETLQFLFEKLFGSERMLSMTQKELLHRLVGKFQRLPSDLSLRVERLIHALLDFTEG